VDRSAALVLVVLAISPAAARAERDADVGVAPPPRHQIGFQAGGSAIVQFVYKVRLLDRLSLEVGGFGAPHAGNGSLGLQLEVVRGEGAWLYLAGGVGGLIAFGDLPDPACPPRDPDCPGIIASTTVGLLTARAGVGFRIARRHRLTFDAGLWRAVRREDEGEVTVEREVTVLPMVGAAWFYAP
jgi:hypothetical protein